MLLRQRMVIGGLHVGEIWRAHSRTMSRSPATVGGTTEVGSGLGSCFPGGRTLYRNVIVSLGRHVMGNAGGCKASTWPSVTRLTLALDSRTSKVGNGVTSKSRQATMVVWIELVFRR